MFFSNLTDLVQEVEEWFTNIPEVEAVLEYEWLPTWVVKHFDYNITPRRSYFQMEVGFWNGRG